MEVVAQGLGKAFGRRVVVHSVDMLVAEGEVTALVGLNGTGKSTVMRLMLGLIRGSGRTSYGGRPLQDYPHPARIAGAHLEGRVGHPSRTALRHLTMAAALTRGADARVAGLLEQVGLAGAAHRPVGGFSLGMRQRLGLATALLADPAVLFLDEPGNGLDVAGRRMLFGLLRQRAGAGKSVLLSSHAMADIEQVADRVVVLAAGRVVAADSVPGLVSRAGGRSTVVRTPVPEELASALRQQGMEVAEVSGGKLTVAGDAAAKIGWVAQRDRMLITELVTRDVSLEEAYLRILAVPAAEVGGRVDSLVPGREG
jgi:ABC-2 type transport system ATP-binding protein